MAELTSKPWTVLALLNWTKEYLARGRVDAPRLAAEVLLAHCLDCPRIELYARFELQPSAEQLARFRSLVKRAVDHEPVAYLVGRKEFYSLSFIVTPDVLIPRAETEGLVTEAEAHLRSLARPGRAWDACTGSGCVAVALARQVADAEVLATDISPEALAVAKRNAQAHVVAERVHVLRADLLNLPEGTSPAPPFDVITANPPYVADGDELAPDVAHEPASALRAGTDGLDCLRPIIASAGGLLAQGGLLALEFGYGQGDAVRDLVVATGQFAEPRIIRDHQQIERIATATRR
jgi:release factor glutamine methyltransferase